MRIKLDHPVLLLALAAAGLFLAVDGPHPVTKADPKPSDRPPSGNETTPADFRIWSITKRVLSEVIDNDLMTQAAAMTFYSLLSLFPGLAMLVSLFGLVADPGTIAHQMDSIAVVLPGGAADLLTEELKSLTSAGSSGLGWAFLISLLTSLWTSNQAMKAMFNALNQVHEVKEKRSFVVLTALTLLCTFGMVLFVVVALAGVVVVPAVLAIFGLSSMVDILVSVLRWPLMLAAVALLLAVMFRFGPCRTKVVWKWITWGSGFASLCWLAVSLLFSWYVANFGSYNKTYGSLGAVVGFMTWIWISSLVVLVGAQLDAELEKMTVGRQRSRHTHDEAPMVLAAS